MTREHDIKWLRSQDGLSVNIRTLEHVAEKSDMLHDAVGSLVSMVICTEDESYELVEGSDFPLQIQFADEGLSVLAPCLYADIPGMPESVCRSMKWNEFDDNELAELVRLVPELQAK